MKHHEQPTLSVVMIMVFIAIIVLILAALAICSHTSTKLGGLVKPSRLNYMPRRARPPYYGGTIDGDDKNKIITAKDESQKDFNTNIDPLITKYNTIVGWTTVFPTGNILTGQIDLIETFIDDTDLGKFLNCFEKPVWYSTPIVPVVSHPKDLQELKSWNWNELTDKKTAIDIITKSVELSNPRSKFMILLKGEIDRSIDSLRKVSISANQNVWEDFLGRLPDSIYSTTSKIFGESTYRATVVSSLVDRFLIDYDTLVMPVPPMIPAATAVGVTAVGVTPPPAASPASPASPPAEIEEFSQLDPKPAHFDSIADIERFTQAINEFLEESTKTINTGNTTFNEANALADKIESVYAECANTKLKTSSMLEDIDAAIVQGLTENFKKKLEEIKINLETTSKKIDANMDTIIVYMDNLLKRSNGNVARVSGNDIETYLAAIEKKGRDIADQELTTLKSTIDAARSSGKTPTLVLSATVPELKVEEAWTKISFDPAGKIFRAPYEKSLSEDEHITKYNESTYTNYLDWLKQKGENAYKNLISNNDPTDYIKFIDVDDSNEIAYSDAKANKYLRKLLSTCIEDELKKNPVLVS